MRGIVLLVPDRGWTRTLKDKISYSEIHNLARLIVSLPRLGSQLVKQFIDVPFFRRLGLSFEPMRVLLLVLPLHSALGHLVQARIVQKLVLGGLLRHPELGLVLHSC